jgi:hypothetical protein
VRFVDRLRAFWRSTLRKAARPFKDELIGVWATDNSSGIHIMFGSLVRFDGNGRGVFCSWRSGSDPEDENDPAYDDELPIEWLRIGVNEIQIKLEREAEWTRLVYQISDDASGYSMCKKLISIQEPKPDAFFKEWFWIIPEGLYQ